MQEENNQIPLRETDRILFREKKKGLLQRIIPSFIMICAFSGLLVLGWFAYEDSVETNSTSSEIPTIKADANPIKIEPETPEEKSNITNLDKKVYETIATSEPEPLKENEKIVDDKQKENPVQKEPVADKKTEPEKAGNENKTELKKEAHEEPVKKPEETMTQEKKPEEKPLIKDKPVEVEQKPIKKAIDKKQPDNKKADKVASKTKTKASGKIKVQLGAFKTNEEANKTWASLKKSNPELKPLSEHIEKADLGKKGIFYRLKTGSFTNERDAKALCDKIKKRNKKQGCFVAK